MKRSLAVLTSFLLGLALVLLPAPAATAAPLPAPYGGTATGDVNAFDLTVGPLALTDVRIANSEATVDSTATPASVSTSRNLAAAVPGLGVTVEENTETAPPNSGPTDGTLAAIDALGITGAAATTTNEANFSADTCLAAGTFLSRAVTQTAEATVAPTGLPQISQTGASSTTSTVQLEPSAAGGLNREVVSTVIGNTAGISLLDGAVTVDVAGDTTLTASADGTAGGADVTYTPGTVNVTAAGTTTELALGATQTVDVGAAGAIGQVVITANEVTETVSADGLSASGEVSVVTLEVRVGPAGAPTATSTIDLLPLAARANVPAGGIDCPPPAPVLTAPADGSTTEDTTPTFTGTGVPGASVSLTLNGTVLDDVATVDADGNFSYTPTTPLDLGDYTASATQTVDGEVSGDSNVNGFEIVADTTAPADPTLETPADGSTTDDTTPTFTGEAEPGSEVEIFVDDESIGTTTAEDDGTYSFTPDTPLADGPHSAYVIATDAAGNPSNPSNVNDFVVEAATAPAAPVITSPEDGDQVDNEFTVEGEGEPGATIVIEDEDGNELGSTEVDGDGNFAVDLDLPDGDYTLTAVQTIGDDTQTSDPVDVTVGGEAEAPGAPGVVGEGLANTGGPTTWVTIAAGLLLLGAAASLTVAARRRRLAA